MFIDRVASSFSCWYRLEVIVCGRQWIFNGSPLFLHKFITEISWNLCDSCFLAALLQRHQSKGALCTKNYSCNKFLLTINPWASNRFLVLSLKNVNQCFPKPMLTSYNVLLTAQRYSVYGHKDGKKPETFTLKKQESENLDFFLIKIPQTV